MELKRARPTHPRGLLQVVPAQRVVQVEADHVAVRQAEVFAHCGGVRGDEALRARGQNNTRRAEMTLTDSNKDGTGISARTGLCCGTARHTHTVSARSRFNQIRIRNNRTGNARK